MDLEAASPVTTPLGQCHNTEMVFTAFGGGQYEIRERKCSVRCAMQLNIATPEARQDNNRHQNHRGGYGYAIY
jgi:hypothetical protein